MYYRTDIINDLILKFGYKKYLEIGVFNPSRNFNHIVAPYKIGIDPDPNAKATKCCTSDVFFLKNIERFDIIFIDGLHHADQVYQDFENSLKCLSKNGCVVFHDCNPVREEHQIVPRKIHHWNGDCWKAWVKLREVYSGLESFVIDTDEGCGIVKTSKENKIKRNDNMLNRPYPKYDALQIDRRNLLNLVSVDFFKEWLINQ